MSSRAWSLRTACTVTVALAAFTGGVVGATEAGRERAQQSPKAAASFREMKWEELVPKGWDPTKGFRARSSGIASDWDPRARALLKEFRVVLDNAPTIETLDGASVKLPGYVVPLETVSGELKEFLLVPYFGACIHTPPPPANQVVFVRMDKAAAGFHTMDTVWVSGILHASRQETFAGNSGYLIDASAVERYVGEPRY